MPEVFLFLLPQIDPKSLLFPSIPFNSSSDCYLMMFSENRRVRQMQQKRQQKRINIGYNVIKKAVWRRSDKKNLIHISRHVSCRADAENKTKKSMTQIDFFRFSQNVIHCLLCFIHVREYDSTANYAARAAFRNSILVISSRFPQTEQTIITISSENLYFLCPTVNMKGKNHGA